MPLKALRLKPGIFRENTRYSAEGGWYECDKVRFRSGQPEKIGGWQQEINDQFLGICRALWPWGVYLGMGTNLKYYVYYGAFYDITPIRTTTTLPTDPFTADGSATITVDAPAHGALTGDFVTFSGATAFSGVTISGEYQVTVLDIDTYTITYATAVTAGSGGGAAVSAEYQPNIGTDIQYPPTPPQVTVLLPNNPFTANGTAVISVNAPSHGRNTGDFVTFNGATAVSGVVISGGYSITVTNANTYTITYSSSVGAGTGGGSAVYATYQLVGGWGSGGWGGGVWGGNATPFVPQQIGLWNAYNYGEDLIYGPKGGAVYYWDASAGFSARGKNIADSTAFPATSSAPVVANFRAVSDASRIVLCFGTNPLGTSTAADLNPMLIRWSAQEDFLEWFPDATNQAGDLLLSRGSAIQAVAQTRQEFLVWTDTALYSLQYIGPPEVWRSQILADNITIVSDRAWAVAAGVTYWMGDEKFYLFDGRVQTLQCDIRKFIFDDFNANQNLQVFASTVEQFSEVWWFYCSITGPDGTGTVSNPNTLVDRYAVYNYAERIWYYGTLGRTAWIDASVINDRPLATDYNRRLIQHETGCDDASTTQPVGFDAYILSSEFDIDDGHNFGFVRRVLPDITFTGSTGSLAEQRVTMALLPLQNSGSGYTRGVDNVAPTADMSVALTNEATVKRDTDTGIERFSGTVTPYDGNLYIRVRGRQMAMLVESTDKGVQWQLGTPRIDLRPSGRKS